MNRVCLTKAGELISMQSGGKVDCLPREHEQFKTDEDYKKYLAGCDALEAMRLNTVRQNALNAGYAEADIEVKWVTDEEWAEIQEANRPIPTYAELRVREYPPIANYVDGIVKGDQAQIDKYIADCLAVKAKYPKE